MYISSNTIAIYVCVHIIIYSVTLLTVDELNYNYFNL